MCLVKVTRWSFSSTDRTGSRLSTHLLISTTSASPAVGQAFRSSRRNVNSDAPFRLSGPRFSPGVGSTEKYPLAGCTRPHPPAAVHPQLPHRPRRQALAAASPSRLT